MNQVMNAFAAIAIWLKKQVSPKTGIDWLDSTQTEMSKWHPTDVLDTSGKTQKKFQERIFAWVSNDAEQLNKCSLSDLKQSPHTSHENHHFGAHCTIGTLSCSINRLDAILMDGSKNEEGNGIIKVEVIRKEQLIDEFERLWQVINEIKDRIKKIPEELNRIGPCGHSRRSKIPVHQKIKR